MSSQGCGLRVGDVAPDLTLPDQYRNPYRLADHRGHRAVMLVFYPFAFSGVCTGELNGFRDRLGEFEADDVTLAAVSCDPVYANRAFADRDGHFFPLLSDFWPHGVVASAFDVFDADGGFPRRSSFLIDRDGRIAWSVHNPTGEARDLDAHAAAVQALRVSARPV